MVNDIKDSSKAKGAEEGKNEGSWCALRANRSVGKVSKLSNRRGSF